MCRIYRSTMLHDDTTVQGYHSAGTNSLANLNMGGKILTISTLKADMFLLTAIPETP